MIWDSFCFIFVLPFGCGDAFCTDTFLQTNDATAQKPLPTAAFTRRYSYTERFVDKKLCTQTPLHTEVFHAKKDVFTHRCFVQRCFCADKKRRIGVCAHKNHFHRETFAQNSFNTCFLHKKHLTQRNLYTQTAHKSFYRPTFLYATIYPNNNYTAFFFSHGNLYAEKHIHNSFYRQTVFTQKIFRTEDLRQKVLRTTFFTYRRFYTQMSSHRHKLHTETCAHSTRLHTTNFYTERLCFPFLITYLSCSPSQFFFAVVQTDADVRETQNCQNR